MSALGRSLGGMKPMLTGQYIDKDNTAYTLRAKYQGTSFFDEFTFFTGDDPTNGNVNYLDQSDAFNAGLANVQSDDGTVFLAVDSTNQVPAGGKRNSVRLTSKDTYNDGLFIADIVNVPYGPGVWPAYWTVGPNWPAGGEIDIVESVNEGTTNQMTLHTNPDCSIDTSLQGAFTGSPHNTDCTSSGGSNLGCAFTDPNAASAGAPFNANSGGVFAHLWNLSQISIWHFPRGSIPQDITSGNPNPSGWGVPLAFWSNSSCDISTHFNSHSIVIDTTICGDWAGSSFGSAGLSGSCSDAVANASNYANAQWKINYIAVYGAASS